jgi:chloramphenicol 3-O phosphotransferase
MRVAALCRAMHSTVIEFSGHGQNVIFDHVMSSDAWHYLLEDFQDQRLFLIRVHCDVEELLRREQARGDREHGLAQSQAERIHENREYDFSIDTSHSSPSECAAALLQWLQQNPRPSAFAKMRSRHAAV